MPADLPHSPAGDLRGLLSNLREETNFISLGAVSCLATASQATSTAGHEDAQVPAVGEVFFYAVAYNNGTSSSYGTATAAKPRITAAGGCE